MNLLSNKRMFYTDAIALYKALGGNDWYRFDKKSKKLKRISKFHSHNLYFKAP